MVDITSVLFLGNNKKYYFKPIDNLSPGDKVVVDTARGLEIGTVFEPKKSVDEKDIVGELKPVVRLATKEDLKAYESNLSLKPQLFEQVKSIISKSGLEMKLLEVEYTLDKSKLVVYFTADGRVDFRELVKDIAAVYKTRIELRQVGSRDASRIISGIGECGRIVCCSSFLGDSQNVTIKMAKNQNLSLNPTTISGICGKLLCCIGFEDNVYANLQEENNPSSDTLSEKEIEDEVVKIEV